MSRDDFAVRIKDALAKRVNFSCSNPRCRKGTSGPHSDPSRVLNIGVAAHITAAAPGGPRYEVIATALERASFQNGIWLCQNCAKLIDADPEAFTVATLRRWKERAEERALSGVGGIVADGLPQPVSAKHTPLPRIRWLPYELARTQLIDYGWHPILRHWSDFNSHDIQAGNGLLFWERGFREIVSVCPTGVAACTFAFRDAYGHVLEVLTEGEADLENGVDTMVASWRIQDTPVSSDPINTPATRTWPVIELTKRPTPTNVLDSIPVGTPSEKVRERFGVPDLTYSDIWQYRFADTQVQVAFNQERSVKSVVIALLLDYKYRGVDAPFGEFVLGELTVQDLADLEHRTIVYSESMRTKELIVPVRTGPAGAWSECLFGALAIHSGVGALAETQFEWDSEAHCLRSRASETVLNWVGIGGTADEPPPFDWYIKA